MKIFLDTHMLDKKETGNERYWKNLALALKKYHPEIKVFLYGNKILAKNTAFLKKFDGVFIPPSDNGLYRIFFGFDQAIEKFKPDLIHVQNFTPIKKTIPIVNTIHDLCFKLHPGLFGLKTNLAFKYFFKKSLDLSDTIICVSGETKNQLLKLYDVDPNKVYVIYEAPDECFKYIEKKGQITSRLWKKLGISDKYFLVVGNIEERKLPYQIIKSFEKITKKFPDTKLVFAGPNKLKINPTKNIRILGYITDQELNCLYNGSLSLIYLSLCEGFGLPIVEAMATKTPVICSDIPVFREITAGNVLLVKDNQDLTKAMFTLIENDNIRKKYSLLGYKRSKKFSWQKTAEETLKVYKLIFKKQSSTL